MNTNSNSKTPDEFAAADLDWLAFRYVANEMDADELTAFETRLGEDQAAREAVARAVELGYAVATVSLNHEVIAGSSVSTAEVAASANRGWLKPFAWMSAGAAACLVAVLLSHELRPSTSEVAKSANPTNATVSDTRSLKLAEVWNQVRQSADENESQDHDSVTAAEEELQLEDPMAVFATGQGNAKSAPSWMSAAVSVTTQGKSPAASAEESGSESSAEKKVEGL